LRHVEGGAARLSCTGVRFAFAAGAAPLVRLRKGEGTANTLAVLAGPAFSDDPHAGFKVVDYRFGDTGQVLTQGVPVAIAPVLE